MSPRTPQEAQNEPQEAPGFCKLAREALQEAPGANRRVMHAFFSLKYNVFTSVFLIFEEISWIFCFFAARVLRNKNDASDMQKRLFLST